METPTCQSSCVTAPSPALAVGAYEMDNQLRRSLAELRDELMADLERVEREEGLHWDVREW